MSYVAINSSYYQMNNPESAWHAGSSGWSMAPVPGWGVNPAQVGPKRLGVEGLGLDITVNDGKVTCAADRQTGILIGVGIGGALVGLAAFLMSK